MTSLVAALLGADEFSFGTALLLAEGCLMVRSCHLDTCPVGIASQKPELRAKYAGTPEMVETYLRFVALEVRELLASLGLRTIDDAVGRVDLLSQRSTGDPSADALDLAPLLAEDRPEPRAVRRRAGSASERPPRRAALRAGEGRDHGCPARRAGVRDHERRPVDRRAPCRSDRQGGRLGLARGSRAGAVRRLGGSELRRVPHHRASS